MDARPIQPDSDRKDHQTYSNQLCPADSHANESKHTSRPHATENPTSWRGINCPGRTSFVSRILCLYSSAGNRRTERFLDNPPSPGLRWASLGMTGKAVPLRRREIGSPLWTLCEPCNSRFQGLPCGQPLTVVPRKSTAELGVADAATQPPNLALMEQRVIRSVKRLAERRPEDYPLRRARPDPSAGRGCRPGYSSRSQLARGNPC